MEGKPEFPFLSPSQKSFTALMRLLQSDALISLAVKSASQQMLFPTYAYVSTIIIFITCCNKNICREGTKKYWTSRQVEHKTLLTKYNFS